jgi:hypothetical protein
MDVRQCEISDSDFRDREEFCPLGCDTVWSDKI